MAGYGSHRRVHARQVARVRLQGAARLPRVPSPEDIFVLVAGGPGKHSCVVPNCCFSRAATRRIALG